MPTPVQVPVATDGGALAPHVDQVLAFKLGEEQYGLAINSIVEILRYRPATPVPRSNPVVHGILSLRGRIITVLDARRRLGLEAAPPDDAARIVVVRVDDEPVGLLVDRVMEVVKLPAASVTPPPSHLERAASRGVAGVAETGKKGLLILLDAVQLVRVPLGEEEAS